MQVPCFSLASDLMVLKEDLHKRMKEKKDDERRERKREMEIEY